MSWTATTHLWTCENGHYLSVSDEGHPNRPGIKNIVLAAWRTMGKKCSDCGARTQFSASEKVIGS